MLQVLYPPANLDACLAAWATQHGLGREAVDLRPWDEGDLEYTPAMLMLGCQPRSLTHYGEVADVLVIDNVLQTITVQGDVSAVLQVARGVPICLTVWNRFHASTPPKLLLTLNSGWFPNCAMEPNGAAQGRLAVNAMLSRDWSMPGLERAIDDAEHPGKFRDFLCDGEAILRYRTLRGDLSTCPQSSSTIPPKQPNASSSETPAPAKPAP